MRYSYRKAELADIEKIAQRMKISDINELAVWTGMSPIDGLTYSYTVSDLRWTMTINEEPLGMGGVAPSGKDDLGMAWLLSKDIPNDAVKPFMRFMDEWLPAMHRRYGVIGNYVSSLNTTTIKWLKRCGFVKKHETDREGLLPWPFYWMERCRRK